MALKSVERRVDELELNKQDTLVSGVTIKTINGNSVLGSGNLTVGGSVAWGNITGTLSDQTDLQTALNAKQNTLISGTNIKTINGNTLLGSGDLTISTGITVGTTAVTSGTDGRVFFQSGGVVQQDSSLFWDNTNKRLGVGTNAPDRTFDVNGIARIRGALTVSVSNLPVINLFDTLQNHTWQFRSNGKTLWFIADGQNRVVYTDTGSVGIGTISPAARLDIRAQGALSTDIAFRVRNSADTRTPFAVLGNELTQISQDSIGFAASSLPLNIKSSTSNYDSWLGLDIEHTVRTGYLAIQSQGIQDTYNHVRFTSGGNKANAQISAYISQTNTDRLGHWHFRTQVHLGNALRVPQTNLGRHTLVIETGTAPTINYTDGFIQYSADIVAGNAAPHFRTENGNIIKLFRGAALTASDGTLANAVTRIAELEARLQAHGLIA